MQENNEAQPVTVEEIQALRNEISLMHESLAKDVIVHAPTIQKVVDIFVNKGLERRWVEKLLAPLVDSSFDDDEMILVAYVLEELDTLLNIKVESEPIEKKVQILVGGTGIGKTSLIGKLGARYSYLLAQPYKVAFMNFDRHKVGAEEQLEQYSDAMDIPLIALEDFADNEYDIILVDTAGTVGTEQQGTSDLIQIIQSQSAYRVEVSLVLSATAKRKDLDYMLEAFNLLPIKNLIFTKLDETSDLSDMIDFLIRQDKSLTYLSTGQEIPEDIIIASKEYILREFM